MGRNGSKWTGSMGKPAAAATTPNVTRPPPGARLTRIHVSLNPGQETPPPGQAAGKMGANVPAPPLQAPDPRHPCTLTTLPPAPSRQSGKGLSRDLAQQRPPAGHAAQTWELILKLPRGSLPIPAATTFPAP